MDALHVIESSDLLDSWEQQDTESNAQFHAFTHFRDLGRDRSINRAWHAHMKDCLEKPQVRNRRAEKDWFLWAEGWGWQSRALDFDRDVDKQARKRLVKDQIDARARHVNYCESLMEVLAVPAHAVILAMQDETVFKRMVEEAKKSSKDLFRLINMVSWASKNFPALIQAHRLSLGLTTDEIVIDDRRENAESVGFRITGDAQATELAIALLDRLAAGVGESLALGAGAAGGEKYVGGGVATSPPSEPPDPEAGGS